MSDRERETTEATELADLERLRGACGRLRAELAKAIVGHEEVLEQLLLCVLAGGHAILEGVPGLAKTRMVACLARCLDLPFARIQFTPDLMPSDITGTEIIQEDKASGTRSLKFLPGPIFASVILADEINRTPPKTQAALLEAMQERQVSVGGRRLPMHEPFFVLATQNPIEQEGTYPLPEAQQDRFMFKIFVRYPDWEQEYRVVRLTTESAEPALSPVMDGAGVLELQRAVRRVPVADHVVHYAMRLVRATRLEAEAPPFIRQYVSWGAGPRACQCLVLSAKARAVLHGAAHVAVEDVRAVAAAVLRHRIITNFTADAESVTPDTIIGRLLETIDPAGALDARTAGVLRKA